VPARSQGYDARFYDIELRDLEHRHRERLSVRDRALTEHELRRFRRCLAVVNPAGCAAFAGLADAPAGLLQLIKLRPTDKLKRDLREKMEVARRT